MLLLARLETVPADTVQVRSGPPGSGGTEIVALTVAFEPGIVGTLLRQGGLGAWILSAPDRGVEALVDSAMDSQQEEALRALGYLQ